MNMGGGMAGDDNGADTRSSGLLTAFLQASLKQID